MSRVFKNLAKKYLNYTFGVIIFIGFSSVTYSSPRCAETFKIKLYESILNAPSNTDISNDKFNSQTEEVLFLYKKLQQRQSGNKELSNTKSNQRSSNHILSELFLMSLFEYINQTGFNFGIAPSLIIPKKTNAYDPSTGETYLLESNYPSEVEFTLKSNGLRSFKMPSEINDNWYATAYLPARYFTERQRITMVIKLLKFLLNYPEVRINL